MKTKKLMLIVIFSILAADSGFAQDAGAPDSLRLILAVAPVVGTNVPVVIECSVFVDVDSLSTIQFAWHWDNADLQMDSATGSAQLNAMEIGPFFYLDNILATTNDSQVAICSGTAIFSSFPPAPGWRLLATYYMTAANWTNSSVLQVDTIQISTIASTDYLFIPTGGNLYKPIWKGPISFGDSGSPNLPDLIVDDISISPANPCAGDQVTITTRLCNIGNADAARFFLRYYVDGSPIGTDELTFGLNAGNCNNESISYTATSPGNHTVRVEVDYDNRIDESNENNNSRQETYNWTDCIPELIVDDISISQADPCAGDQVTITTRLCNIGSGNAGLFFLQYLVDGVPIGTDELTFGLNAGNCNNESITYTATSPGNHTVSVEVDYDNRIDEINENNNNREETYNWADCNSNSPHFNPVDPTGLPYIVIVFITNDLKTSINLSIGDRIGLFDHTFIHRPLGWNYDEYLCVGSAIYSGSDTIAITAWEEDEGNKLPGFRQGSQIYVNFWDTSDLLAGVIDHEAVQGDGTYGFSPFSVLKLHFGTDVESIDDFNLPTDFELFQNYPNPFNPETRIEFALPTASFVTIDIYNLLGEKVNALVSKRLSAGLKAVTWDGTDDFGRSVSSGVYFYKIAAGDFVLSKKMLLLK